MLVNIHPHMCGINQAAIDSPEKHAKKKYYSKTNRNDGEWLQANVPALHLCYSSIGY
jgi:hypothetical protein